MNTDDIWFLGSRMRIVADGSGTGGQLTVMEQWAPPGFSPPVHVHHGEDTALHVLDGSLTVRVGDAERELGPGGLAWLPRDVPHGFVVGADGVHLLEYATPAGIEEFHRAAGEPATGPGLPEPAPPDVGALVAAFARHDGEIVGPPMGDEVS